MAQVDAIVGGVTYSLSDGTLCYRVGQDGLGHAPVHRLRTRGPQQHGSTDRGFLLDPRLFRLMFDVPGDDSGDVYDRRTSLIRILGAQEDPVKLRFILDNGDQRIIEADLVDDLAYPTAARRGYLERAVVSMSAADPSFYDPAWVTVTFGLSQEGAWEIPWVIPWPIGEGEIGQTAVIAYTGNWISFPVITVTGPVTDLRIENLTTGDVLDFTGSTIATGEVWTIDTRYGAKTVVDTLGVSQISALTDEDDLATFHLAAAIDGSGSRDNEIGVTGSGVTSATLIELVYFLRYKGI